MAKKRLLIPALIGIFLLSACSSNVNKLANDTIYIGITSDPIILNPILSTDSASSDITDMIFSGLVKVNPKLQIVPDLCDTWTVSADGKIYTFKIRHGIKWHDGTPFTAYDAKFTYDIILDTRTQTVRREMFSSFSHFDVPDSYTLIAYLKKPYAPAIVSFGMSIIPKHIFEGKDINTTEWNNKPIGTGPYEFVAWKRGQYVLLKANPTYFMHKPNIAKILFKVIPEETVQLMNLERGSLDMTSIPPAEVGRLKKNNRIQIFYTDQLAYSYIGFNLRRPLFKNKKIRQALSYLVNRKAIVKYIQNGLGTPATGPIPPVGWAYTANVKQYTFNPRKGLNLLNEAGFKNKDKKGFLVNAAGKELTFNLATNQGNDVRKQVLEFVQATWRKYGINASVNVVEWSSFIKKYINSHNFDAVLLGWQTGIDPGQYAIWHSSQMQKGFNFIGYSNPKVDKLLESGRREMDRQKRKNIYFKFQKEIADDAPYIFLYYPKGITGVSKRINVVKPTRFSLMYNFIDWNIRAE